MHVNKFEYTIDILELVVRDTVYNRVITTTVGLAQERRDNISRAGYCRGAPVLSLPICSASTYSESYRI